MTPMTREILQSLPLPIDEFVRRHGEQVLQGMTLAGAVRVSNGQVHIAQLGTDRLQG